LGTVPKNLSSRPERSEVESLLYPVEQPIWSVWPILPISFPGPDPLVVWPIDVHRNALDSRRRGHKHEPASFILHEIQEIILTIHFKLQFVFSLGPKSGSKICSAGTAALHCRAGLGLDGSETRPYTALLISCLLRPHTRRRSRLRLSCLDRRHPAPGPHPDLGWEGSAPGPLCTSARPVCATPG